MMKRFFYILYKGIAWGLVFLIIFTIITNITIYSETKPYIYDDVIKSPNAEVVLIPGAAVLESGALSSIFIDRVDFAIKLYEAKKVKKILVSGDNSTESHNEVNPVRLYLLKKGIPDQDIFLDHAGFDTYSSMYRAHSIFGVTSVIISRLSHFIYLVLYLSREKKEWKLME